MCARPHRPTPESDWPPLTSDTRPRPVRGQPDAQATRYTDTAVGPEAINAFYGALQRKRADRGVFITSSTFTTGARAAEKDFRTIVLIDGPMLARLMVDHGVGVQVASTHTLKRLDQDYFDEL